MRYFINYIITFYLLPPEEDELLLDDLEEEDEDEDEEDEDDLDENEEDDPTDRVVDAGAEERKLPVELEELDTPEGVVVLTEFCEGTVYVLVLPLLEGATLLITELPLLTLLLLTEGVEVAEFVLVRVVVVLYEGRVVVLLLLYVGVYVLFTELYSGLVAVSLLITELFTVPEVGFPELLVAVVVDVRAEVTTLPLAPAIVLLLVFAVLVTDLLTDDKLLSAVLEAETDVIGSTLLEVERAVLSDETVLLAARLLLLIEDTVPAPAVERTDKLLIRSLLPYWTVS